MSDAITRLRRAQPGWAATPIRDRLAIVRKLRKLLVREADSMAAAASRPAMSRAEVMLAEILPLAAACRFLERRAEALLSPRPVRATARPLWLFGTRLTVERVPLGVVLILAPGNYPLLLAGVQLLQALVAGNAVAVKPATGSAPPMLTLADMLARSGLPPGLLAVLDDSLGAGKAAVAAPVDHVVLTGSVQTGRAVLAALAARLVPATMELSGSDPCLVLDGADIDAAATAIVYGLTLNGGATCIAPRRILVSAARRPALVAALSSRLEVAPARPIPERQASLVRELLASATGPVLGGADALTAGAMRPLILCDSMPAQKATEDAFAPVAFLLEAADADAAVALANESPYALGASVFGASKEAARVARRLRAGCITINDMIVPTADPQVPFGGAGQSGFGTTRGPEGLLALTRTTAILTRTRPTTRHLRTVPDRAAPLLRRVLRVLYG